MTLSIIMYEWIWTKFRSSKGGKPSKTSWSDHVNCCCQLREENSCNFHTHFLYKCHIDLYIYFIYVAAQSIPISKYFITKFNKV